MVCLFLVVKWNLPISSSRDMLSVSQMLSLFIWTRGLCPNAVFNKQLGSIGSNGQLNTYKDG